MKSIGKSIIVSVIFCTVVMLLPQLALADAQSAVTETSSIKPYEDNSNAQVNVANSTITTNIDTWDPLPTGIFVGGTIQESKMRLHEVAGGADAQLLLTTIIQPRREYLMSGVSEFEIRLPVSIDSSSMPKQVNFAIWQLSGPTYAVSNDMTYYLWPSFGGWADTNPYYPPWDLLAHRSALRLAGSPIMTIFNVAHLNTVARPHSPAYPNLTLWNAAGTSSYLSGDRLYVHMICPLLPDLYYVLATQIFYAAGQPMDIYLCPSDLASDNLTDSHVAYTYWPSPDSAVFRDNAVPADLGYSFVFESGLGGHAFEYNSFYGTDDTLSWMTYVRVPAATVSGAMNFILEYRTNSTVPIEYQLDVWDAVRSDAYYNSGINGIWWNHKTANSGYILASNPVNYTYEAASIGGYWYLEFHCYLTILTAARIQFMTVKDVSWPWESNFVAHSSPTSGGAYYFDDILGFGMWASISVENQTLNDTAAVNLGQHHTGFWEGLGNWWSDHWMDIIGGELIVIGALAIAITGWTGVGGAFGVFCIGLGIGMILYNNHVLDGVIKMIIDGLTWLGSWLWKIASFIWKALTWFIDQAIYYGSILIGLLIIAVAIALFIGPLYAMIKIMGAFLMMAQGDYEKAAAQLSGLATQGSHVANTLTGGRVG